MGVDIVVGWSGPESAKKRRGGEEEKAEWVADEGKIPDRCRGQFLYLLERLSGAAKRRTAAPPGDLPASLTTTRWPAGSTGSSKTQDPRQENPLASTGAQLIRSGPCGAHGRYQSASEAPIVPTAPTAVSGTRGIKNHGCLAPVALTQLSCPVTARFCLGGLMRIGVQSVP